MLVSCNGRAEAGLTSVHHSSAGTNGGLWSTLLIFLDCAGIIAAPIPAKAAASYILMYGCFDTGEKPDFP